jgi:pimeloyl-ACP methyl ester carboxylesterase
MPFASVNGAQLQYEVTGDGFPVVFSHEFGGDSQSWAPQVRHFSRLYRCVTYNHRGFPPSSVPERLEDYSQDILVDDLGALMDHLRIERAHIVGLSMGGNVALNFALGHPERCHGIVVAGCGGGTTQRERFEQDVADVVRLLTTQGIEAFADRYAAGATRQSFQRKDPQGWQEFRNALSRHSPLGSALTIQGVQRARPPIFALKERLNRLDVPTLILIGDEDEPCVDPAVFMKREIPAAGLMVIPQSGHTINLEEPALFNAAVADFLRLLEAGRWARRPAVTTKLLGGDDR